jgi:hypothetical protein
MKRKPRISGAHRWPLTMADNVLTVPRSALSKPFARLTTADLGRVDVALRFWLGF